MNDQDLERYSRQLLVPGLELEGQDALAAAHVLVVGCGGLGALASMYLGAAGVGQLTLVDPDVVELSNLPRQVAFTEEDIGKPKAEALAARLCAMNSALTCSPKVGWFSDESAEDLLGGVGGVIDGTDNHLGRQSIDRQTAARGIPWFMGGAVQMAGQNVAFSADRGEGCYHCLAPQAVDTEANPCATLGILGPVVGSVALQQAMDVLAWLTAVSAVPWGVLRQKDFRSGEVANLAIDKRIACPVCH